MRRVRHAMLPERKRAGESRLGQLRALMAKAGTELVLIYGSGGHDLTRSNWCWYHSGFKQLGPDACLCVTLEGDSLLLVTPAWDHARACADAWVETVEATDALVGTLAAHVSARGWLSARTLLIDFQQAPSYVAKGVEALFPNQSQATQAAGATLMPTAYDAWGHQLIAHAVGIAEAAYDRLQMIVEPGMLDFELAAHCEAALREGGAESTFVVICASQHHLGPTPPVGRVLETGDIVLAELSPAVDGQFAQICRTMVIGEVGKTVERNLAILAEAFDESLNMCRPGVSVGDVARAANAVITRHGFGDYIGPRYSRARGHAVGLGSMTPNVISDQIELPLQAGMSFVLHPNQYFPDSGYLFFGNQIVVTDTGARALARELSPQPIGRLA